MKGVAFSLERVILRLHQEGWLIERVSNTWVAALRDNKGLLFATLTPGQRLNPPQQLLDQNPQIKHWEAMILCPSSLSSHDMKEIELKKVQSWFIDLTTGAVFPYPANSNRETLNWVLSLAAQPQTDPNGDAGSSNDNNQRSTTINSTRKERLKNIPYITYTLIAVNLLIFLLMTLAGGSTNWGVLILFGAKVNSLILQGEVWRLVTSMFLHIGFLHLTFNLYALYALGSMAEELFGRVRYLIIYFASGILGSVASFLFVDALSAGASGAIFGVLGALVPYARKHKHLWNSGFGKNLVVIILINLSLGLFQPGIDMSAHIGGLIGGLILGKIFS